MWEIKGNKKGSCENGGCKTKFRESGILCTDGVRQANNRRHIKG